MQVYIPKCNAVFVPILKNASRSLVQTLTENHLDHIIVGRFYPGERVVMWRDPKKRIESTYRFLRDQGVEMPFAKWVTEVCDGGLQDPHLKPQYTFCDNPQGMFWWDFDGFRRFFGIKASKMRYEGESPHFPTEWDDRAKQAFEKAYSRDISIWERGTNAQAFRAKAACAELEKDGSNVSGSEISLGSSQIDGPGR